MSMKQIGRYEIIRELGRGGMATVFLAHDPNFGRQVAIKVLPRDPMNMPNYRSRFQREAETLARLEHPGIVPVYDFGEHEGQPYLVMRYMPGGSLADRLAHGPLPLSEVQVFFERLGQALDFAHQRGVIHRDLKPDNVLFDEQDNPYIADFGIAKLTESTTTLTGSAVIGTPIYMSPEQFGAGGPVDQRSDIYALGIMLFEMLSGNPPFLADTPAQVMRMHLMEPVPALHIPSLPTRLQAVVEQALAKDPAKRFQTAAGMAGAVTAAITGARLRPVPETRKLWREPRAQSQVGSFTKNYRGSFWVWLGVGSGVLVLVAVGLFLIRINNAGNLLGREILSQVTIQPDAAKQFTNSPTSVLAIEATGALRVETVVAITQTPLLTATSTISTATPLPGQIVDTFGHVMLLIPGGDFERGITSSMGLAAILFR